ncbi:MAG: hypothetical protein NTV21_16730 [Planctomycetota bacterium]|nr:hypothetical protein [Planctomycetota bacterium]
MGAKTTSLRTGRAILAWLVLYVVGLFAQGAHVAFERHEVCEHGEFAHVEEAAESAGIHGAEAHDEGEHLRGTESAGEDEHHHCGIALASPVVAAEFSAPAGLEPLAAPCAVVARADTPRVDGIERLRLAPHHSPPRS